MAVIEVTQEKKATFDQVLARVGNFGWWHVYIYTYLSFYSIIGAWLTFGINFLKVTPEHWCAVRHINGSIAYARSEVIAMK